MYSGEVACGTCKPGRPARLLTPYAGVLITVHLLAHRCQPDASVSTVAYPKRQVWKMCGVGTSVSSVYPAIGDGSQSQSAAVSLG